ncbi:hypothetical protein AgCh_033968 [Apium graveolens]
MEELTQLAVTCADFNTDLEDANVFFSELYESMERLETFKLGLLFFCSDLVGFDEYMNLVLDNAEEVSMKKKIIKPLGVLVNEVTKRVHTPAEHWKVWNWRSEDIQCAKDVSAVTNQKPWKLYAQPILEKGIVDHSIIHRLLIEYGTISDQLMNIFILLIFHHLVGITIARLWRSVRKDVGVIIPFLDDDNYHHWKVKMHLYLLYQDEAYVDCIERGPHVPMRDATGNKPSVPKPRHEWSDPDIEQVRKDKKAMNILFNGVDGDIFDIINCKSPKEVWDII